MDLLIGLIATIAVGVVFYLLGRRDAGRTARKQTDEISMLRQQQEEMEKWLEPILLEMKNSIDYIVLEAVDIAEPEKQALSNAINKVIDSTTTTILSAKTPPGSINAEAEYDVLLLPSDLPNCTRPASSTGLDKGLTPDLTDHLIAPSGRPNRKP